MQAIGYKELVRVMEEGRPISEAVGEIRLRSRQYAKRQLTWFRRLSSVRWHLWGAAPDFSEAIHEATKYMEEFGL
jgi:tRNA dimethylallyltransferase